jgi:hypothetical protein
MECPAKQLPHMLLYVWRVHRLSSLQVSGRSPGCFACGMAWPCSVLGTVRKQPYPASICCKHTLQWHPPCCGWCFEQVSPGGTGVALAAVTSLSSCSGQDLEWVRSCLPLHQLSMRVLCVVVCGGEAVLSGFLAVVVSCAPCCGCCCSVWVVVLPCGVMAVLPV